MKELAIKLLKAKYDEYIALRDLGSEDYIKLFSITRETWVLEYLLSRAGDLTKEEAEELNKYKTGEK